jgi:hypothetical protein
LCDVSHDAVLSVILWVNAKLEQLPLPVEGQRRVMAELVA